MFSRDRLSLEYRVRKILAAIADEVRSGTRKLTATNPRTHQRFEPDPAYLETLLGSDRSREQITTDDGVLRSMRLTATAEADPNQPELPGMGKRPSQRRHGTALNAVVEKMRADGLAKAEAMTGVEQAQHYNTTERTARRARAQLREEGRLRQQQPDEPSETDK